MNNTTFVLQAVGKLLVNLSLEKLNEEEAIRRSPVVIFIIILIVIGLFGNVHVLYIYLTKFNVSTYRIFVLSLAAIDTTSCCVSMPFEIVDELNPYIFEVEIACKIFRFLNTCLAMATALMLVVIASERYRKICKPYGNQMSEKQARYWLIGVVCFAVCASLPAVYVYGRKTIDIPGQTIKGSECTWADYIEGTFVGYAYFAWGLLVIIVCMVLLVILYSLVGSHLRTHTIKVQSTIRIRRRKSRKKFGQSSRNIMKGRNVKSAIDASARRASSEVYDRERSQSDPLDGRPARFKIMNEQTLQNGVLAEGTFRRRSSEEANIKKTIIKAILSVGESELHRHLSINNGKPKCHHPNTMDTQKGLCALAIECDANSSSATNQTPLSTNAEQLCDSPSNVEDNHCAHEPVGTPVVNTISRRGGTVMRKTKTFINEREQRITKVLFTITLLFIFSFLPYIIILIVYSADATYEEKLSPTAYVIYLMGLRLYLINNIANSLLYISFDLKFRKHFFGIYQKIYR